MCRRTVNGMHPDKSNGYEEAAKHFMAARNRRIGSATVRAWSRTLAPATAILDLGCGHGMPISQVLVDEGFTICGIDASARLIAEFRRHFPSAQTECSAVEESEFFGRQFDAIVAWGLMFLLPGEVQSEVIHKVARALNSGGKFLFTSTKEAVNWRDSITGRESVSLGAERYRQILLAAGLSLEGEDSDEGENHYYFAVKPPAPR